ncbi:MAG TPA: hypothetical protein VN936_02095 [Candidatus Acidoferrum sp.]|nr:hypothetical protein [Candidatus Acidoferrum sp.]
MIRLLGLLATALASLVLFTACASHDAAVGSANLVPAVKAASGKQTFHFTGIVQTFQVPTGVDRVTIAAEGAGTPSARGGFVRAAIAVTPGDTLSVSVGGAPGGMQGGYNGGADGGPSAPGYKLHGAGGAGASDVRLGGTALDDRIVVAGGAGGRGGRGQFLGGPGGESGGLIGARGDNGVTVGYSHGPFHRAQGGAGAGGATQRRGGTPGAGGSAYIPGNRGSKGALGVGGGGANDYCQICSVSYGLIAGGSGGGGGGGYYGGGGGGSGGNNDSYVGYGRTGIASGGGGGGGSSYAERNAQNVTIESGRGSTGNGLITISW